ncbi:MAG: membrane protein insertion efficiency factor YidD [Acidimicrobiales bacterium]
MIRRPAPDSTERPPGDAWLVRLLGGGIRTYQLLRGGRPSPCRFTPSCSSYASEALLRHGARRGIALTARRLVRCRPRGPFGVDPVPE